MRSFSVIIVLFLLSSCGHADSNSLTKAHLKGKVKSITEWEYDSLGRVVTQIINSYDQNGNNVEGNLFSMGNHIRSVSTYDWKNRCTQSIFYRNNKLSDNGVYKYDNRNNRTESYTTSPDGKTNIVTRYKYRYNENDKPIEKREYSLPGKLRGFSAYKYDANGNQIEITAFKIDSTIIKKINATYDSSGNCIEVASYNWNTEEIIATYQYENYDKAGNWQKMTKFEDGKIVGIKERKIEYY